MCVCVRMCAYMCNILMHLYICVCRKWKKSKTLNYQHQQANKLYIRMIAKQKQQSGCSSLKALRSSIWSALAKRKLSLFVSMCIHLWNWLCCEWTSSFRWASCFACVERMCWQCSKCCALADSKAVRMAMQWGSERIWLARAVWHKTLDISWIECNNFSPLHLPFLLRCTCVGEFVTQQKLLRKV